MERVLATFWVLAMLVLAGCAGGSGTNAPEQGEKEDARKPAGGEKAETTARVAPGYTASEQASADAAKAAAAEAGVEATHDGPASASPAGSATASATAGTYEEASLGETVEIGTYAITVHDAEVVKRYGAYSLRFDTVIENEGPGVGDASMDLDVSLSNPAGKLWDQDISYDPPNLRTIPPGRKAAGKISFFFDETEPSGTYYLDITGFAPPKTVTFTAKV